MIGDYHNRIELAFDGWPAAYTDDDRKRLTEVVTELLSDGQPRTLTAIYDAIRGDQRLPEIYSEARLWDFIYASLDRAARTIPTAECGYWVPRR